MPSDRDRDERPVIGRSLMAVPPQIEREIANWQTERRTGSLRLNFRAGRILHLHREEMLEVVADDVEAGPAGVPRCPSCGKPMTEFDYGNAWSCSCGAKRTKAQIEADRRDRKLTASEK